MARRKIVLKKRKAHSRFYENGSPRDYLEKCSKEELIEFIIAATKEYPRINERFMDRDCLTKDKINQITEDIRLQIQSLEPNFTGYDNFSTSDFDHIHERLSKLLESNHADEVVDLGTDFIKIAPLRYEYDHTDDWGISCGIDQCLQVILKALPRSSLSLDKQLIWYIDGVLNDNYGIFSDVENITEHNHFKKEDWANVYAVLKARLEQMNVPAGDVPYSQRYRHEQLSRWVKIAAEKGGDK
jgi:uncharacterized Zn finger protein